MIDTGHKIALEVNKVSKYGGFNDVTLEVDENNFFATVIHVFVATL
jgi:hypothetical protein